MKVCIVVWNSIWFDPRVRKQIISYLDNGFDVVCVGQKCRKYNADKVKNIPCPTKLIDYDPYIAYNRSPIKKLQREWYKDKTLSSAILSESPDVIHANDLDTLVACVNAARKLKCRVVYDSHEICVENHHVKGLYKKYAAWSEWNNIKKVDAMVCVSNAAADYFVKKYGIQRPMVVTNCSLLSERVVADTKHDGFEILNHGQFYGGRGYDIMVESSSYLRQYPEIKLALRGFGPMEEELRQRSEELNSDQVIFYPRVLVEELIPMAAKSHVGVAITEPTCLNFELSVSNKLFEYASAGLPVIMSDIPEHRYLNDTYQFGVIIPDNSPESFAKAVIKLYTDKEFYEKCKKNAISLSDEINWENEFKKLIDIEKKMMTSR